MERFKNILAYVNLEKEDHPALERAIKLAQRNSAALKVAAVLPDPPWYARIVGSSSGINTRLVTEAEKHLQTIVGKFQADGLNIESKLLFGRASMEIVREALRGRHDLVMKTAEGSAGGSLFGTTATSLMRNCPCPVWIIKPATRLHCNCILAAVDVDPGVKECGLLNCSIMDIAVSLARLDNAELYVIHVAGEPYERALRRYMTEKEFLEHQTVRDENTRKELVEFLDSYRADLPESNIVVETGVPATHIVATAKAKNVDLVVMGTVARTGIPGMLIGNTAEQVLSAIDRSVLTVKPAGFISPVTIED